MNINFETLSKQEAIKNLKTDSNKGLTSDEVKLRQEKYGENKLKEKKKKSVFKIFIEQMNNPMIFVLFIAIAITIGVSIYETIKFIKAGTPGNPFLDSGDWPDVIIILLVILLNSLIGTIQEKKAESSLNALKRLSTPLVKVIRDNKTIKIKSSELTIGDIVLLEDGDIVGADMRLIESFNLKVNESSLTGESLPVEKNADITFSKTSSLGDRINMLFSSTNITYGRGKAVVTSIGMNTEIGKIATSLNEEETELTPLQKVLEKLSKFLGILTLIIVILVFLADMIWILTANKGGDVNEWIEAVLSSIALAVAAIPEGLVAVVTIVLAIGVTRMVKANAIIRKLPSVETLGSVNVICSDKTGTLTQNKMTVVNAYTNHKRFDKFNDELNFLATGMALCSNASKEFGDPTEIALINFLDELKLDKSKIDKEYPRIDELPFDSIRKMMSIRNKKYVFTKGALDSILKNTTQILIKDKVRKISKEDIKKIKEINSYYSSKSLRVLALAYSTKNKITEKDLIFVGLVAMIDPPRKEVRPAVAMLKQAGIRTVMITGDYKDTAFAIAKDLGIANNKNECLSGVELDNLSFDQLKEKVKSINVFARVSPKNKVDIVKAIKANDNIVAMTGDGVNDAPSLKGADIGIAMGITGTDVAKEAGDMILTDDNFASIEKAVEEGRGIYANIKKTVLFLLSSNIAEVLAMFIIICLGFKSPFIAIHLLWVNLITDSTPAIALGMDAKDKDVMKEKPRDKKDSFFSHGGLKLTFMYGIIITISVLIAYFIPAWMNHQFTYNAIKMLYENDATMLLTARTMAFTTLAISELFHMIGMSNINRSFIHTIFNKNKMMYFAFFVGLALQVFVVVTPGVNTIFKTTALSWQYWLITIGLSILPLLVHELIVLFRRLIK